LLKIDFAHFLDFALLQFLKVKGQSGLRFNKLNSMEKCWSKAKKVELNSC
jgi:hypothetical protein